MNKTFALAAGALIGLVGYGATVFAADVGVSISVGQPGFYGRIDLGDAPRPRIYYPRRWKDHCHEYQACGQRVYFVNDNWYNTVYVPHHRERGGRHDGGYDNRQGGRGRNEGDHRGNSGKQHSNGKKHD